MANTQALTAQNAQRWRSAKPTRAAFNSVAKQLVAAKDRYQTVTRMTGVPWWVVAVIHEREASQNWNTQLGQGDPLDQVSTHVPKGRGPFVGPDAWEKGAVDALVNCPPYAARWNDWSAGGALTLLEEYNGLGYAGKGVPSPYVWSGTDQYMRGKYVADHVFDPNVTDVQLGCAGLLMAMQKIDPSIRFADEAMPPPDVEHVPAPKPKVTVKAGSATIAAGSTGAAAHQAGLPWWACIGIVILAAAAVYGAIHYFKRKD